LSTASATWLRAAGVLAVLGATVGTALDGLHTHTGTTWYPQPDFWRASIWVPPLFAAAALGIGLGRPFLERRLGLSPPAPSLAVTGGGMAVFVLCYAMSAFWPGSTVLKFAALALLAAASGHFFDRSALGLGCMLGVALAGCGTEMALVHRGAFFHRDTEFFGVPAWLPMLYACASVALGNLGRRLTSRSSRGSP